MNSEARKRAALSQPIPAPVDSGAIGRLTEAERAALDAAACGNCGERTAVRRVAERIAADRGPKPSRFPVEQEFAAAIACLLAGRADGQQAVATLTAIHERILREHTDRALAEAWDAALRHVWALNDPAYMVITDTESIHPILTRRDVEQAANENPYRAARQEQGR